MGNLRIILFSLITAAFTLSRCENYNLVGKFESPGGETDTVFVVSTNISNSSGASSYGPLTVTFNKPIQDPSAGVTISSPATISPFTTADNITWTFTINNMASGSNNYTIDFSSAIKDLSGKSLKPFTVTFTYNNIG